MGSKRLARLTAACALVCSSQLVAAPPLTAPAWNDLTPDQQRTLSPLAREWRDLPDERKRKWAGIADRFPGYTPEEQSRLQRRMETWFSLTPEQRTVARDQYRNLQRIPPEQREALRQKWITYQELPSEEKQRFNEAAKKAGRQAGHSENRCPSDKAPERATSATPGKAENHRQDAAAS